MSKRVRWIVGVTLGVVLVGVGVLVGALVGGRGEPAPGPAASPTTPSIPTESPKGPTEPAGAAACEVDYVVRDSWADGFTVDVTVRNGAEALDGWELAWRFAGEEKVANLWNGVLLEPAAGGPGAEVRVRDAGHNAKVPRGGSITLGFVGAGASAGRPSSFTLDGHECGTEVGSTPSASSSAAPDATAATGFYLDPTTRAASAAAAASGEERTLLEKIARTPQAFWVTGTDLAAAAAEVRDYTTRARDDGTLGLLVVYAVPGRDCGQHSSGGVDGSAYARWVDAVADAIVGEPWVVLEPDALPMLGDCDGQGDRVGYLAYAAKALSAAGARVYVDAGHSAWLPAEEAARRLKLVGLEHVAGFALNVSNYQSTEDSVAYGEKVAALAGGTHFVVDTSRNGNGSDGQWCNPPGRALGERPRLLPDDAALDALVWVKRPGESDGECHGGPAAGQWFEAQALELARGAGW